MSTLVRDNTGMKTCTRCNETKPLDAFSPDKRGKQGRQSVCKICCAARARDRYATDPAYVQRHRDAREARRRGEELPPLPKPSADERFDAFLVPEPNTGCLIFLGGQFRTGYGKFKVDGKTISAHRFAYEREFGPIPEGLEVHHECFTPLCCEPSHLRAVTPEEHAAIHAKEVE